MKILARHLLSPQQYSVKTSSEQKAYPASNLSDMNLETAWVGKGSGDWIEFFFDEDSPPLAGVHFVNGYQKSVDTYTQNNRVKTLRIEFRGEELETGWDIPLEDKPYEPMFFEDLFHHDFYYDFFDAYDDSQRIRSVKFIIKETYPGTNYNDTCLSEILFFKRQAGF